MFQQSLRTRFLASFPGWRPTGMVANCIPVRCNIFVYRCFSSNNGNNDSNTDRSNSNNRNNKPQNLRRFNERASSNRVGNQQNQGWRSNRNNPNNRNKPNFSETFLEPAARGELKKKHQSGIPKLANRKQKGHAVRGADPSLDTEVDDAFSGYTSDDDVFLNVGGFSSSNGKMRSSQRKTGTIAEGSKIEDLSPEEYDEVIDFIQMYEALAYLEDKEEYYWNEVDYEKDDVSELEAMFDKLKEEATTDADGNLVVEVDDETFANMESFKVEESNFDGGRTPQQHRSQAAVANDEVEFVMDAMGIKGYDTPPDPKTYDVVMPLNLKGPTINDFVESMMEHPTKFGQLKFQSPHPDSKREPVPNYPPRRRNPPLEFVESHSRFVHVWGLPPLVVDDQSGDLENPAHAMEIQILVASLFDVQPEAVYPSTRSSAFVGFASPADQRFALEFGPIRRVIESPVTIAKYTPKDGDKRSFEEGKADCVVLLDNLPEGHTPASLASALFPSYTDAGIVFGGLQPEDYVMIAPHSAVLKFDSAEKADNAIASAFVEQRLIEFGQHRVRYNKARRELVYTGEHTGPFKTDPVRTLGTKLIVDGDMPKKVFFLSHATTLHLRNLDPSTTKQDIADFFQSCCALPRDVQGSVELVTCYEGLPTGKAFVGFDDFGEAEAAMSLCESNGRLSGLGRNKVIMKRVREAIKSPREKRPAREENELLDSLDNWEQFVDPKDLEELYEHISKEALDEALRAIRHNNPTFSSMDQALRSETVNPEKEVGGMYREMVQSYVATLKACISTPEDPGLIYESLFLPDEEVDTEIFEAETIRQEELKKRREVP